MKLERKLSRGRGCLGSGPSSKINYIGLSEASSAKPEEARGVTEHWPNAHLPAVPPRMNALVSIRAVNTTMPPQTIAF
jgi:hypothetical protein